MRGLWYAIVEWLRRKGILARAKEYRVEGEKVERIEKGQVYSRRRNLFPSSARQVKELREKVGLSQRQTAVLWGRAWRRSDGIRITTNSNYVAECEQGHRVPTVREFAKLKEVAVG